MASDPIPLGPFELLQPIGRGAMGEVWSALHRRQQLPVAVKVVTAEHARRSDFRAAFHNEVRSVAQLNHPGIVVVLDYGVLPDETARQTGGHLVAGSPYFIMEYASGGTLPRTGQPMAWTRLRHLLLELLDALAHAHARGVVHRDIKPANILIANPEDGRPGLKLTDFGIARALGMPNTSESTTVSGTPHYMAPEQILNELRNQGPWTDLYSLGCLAYQFATGRRMYAGTGHDVLRAQVHELAPPIKGPHVPKGFQRWLERMLAKRPEDRYRLAADAAWGLASLGAADAAQPAPARTPKRGDAPTPSVHDEDTFIPGKVVAEISLDDISSALVASDNDTIRVDTSEVADAVGNEVGSHELATLSEIFVSDWDLVAVEQAAAKKSGRVELRSVIRPPIPKTWRGAAQQAVAMPFVDAGLGLYGLRTVPMVDRNSERDRIWSALREIDTRCRTQMFFLQGGAGYGKSRLVEWLSQRANEVGAALVLRASHSAIAGPSDGLGPMINAHLHCGGLSRTEILERIQRFITHNPMPGSTSDDAAALTELVAAPATPDDPALVHFSSPEERYGVVYRLLHRLCLQRPVILWLDDVHQGADALAFCRFALDMQDKRPLPIMILATVRDDLLPSRPSEKAWVEEILDRPDVEVNVLGPLEDIHQEELVTQLLHLDGKLAEAVVARTAGNPLFAVQLVGDWVERGVLAVGEYGFQLRKGERAEVPDDIQELWTQRLQQLIRDRNNPDSIWSGLEIAAALGRDFHPQEWQIACALAGAVVPEPVVELLLQHRLLERTPSGLAFAHGMLQESLDRTAREGRRSRKQHLACADMLERSYPGNHPLIAERRGEHLMQGGELGAALEPLLIGANGRVVASEYGRALELYRRRNDAMVALGVSASDQRWGVGWVRESRCLLYKGDLAAAEALADKALEAAHASHWPHIQALGGAQKGFVMLSKGETSGAIEAYQNALRAFARVDLPVDHADALSGIGAVHVFRHELDVAEAFLNQAIELHRSVQDTMGEAKTLRVLSNLHQNRGDFSASAQCLEKSLATFNAAGHRYDVASCYNDLGEVWRAAGNLEEAEWFYRKSLEGYEAVGTLDVSTPKFNLGLVLLMREKFQEAQDILLPELDLLLMLNESLDIIWFLAGMLPCYAAANDFASFDTVLTELGVRLQTSEIVDRDIPFCASQGAQLCEKRGQRKLARAAWQLVLEQYVAMKDERNASLVQQRIAALS